MPQMTTKEGRVRCSVFSRYDRLGASSRLRMFQYRPWLERAGMAVTEAPFFNADYLEALYSGKSVKSSARQAFLLRIKLLRAARGQLIWLEKEALPFLPWAAERALWPRGAQVVSDYDDAVFHRYDLHRNAAVRALLGRKIGAVMATSKIVFAGNAYLADHAYKAGAQRIEIIPTVVNTNTYSLQEKDNTGQNRVGWIGSPSTWAEFGLPLSELVCDVLNQHNGVFRVIGGGQRAKNKPGIEALDWSEETEVDHIKGMDIGIMPLSDTPWARGKCGYKLIQYMACGLPVVASPVGVNNDIVTHGETGFLASTPEEWRRALTILLADPALRRRMGAAGRARVERNYSLQVWGPRVAELLIEATR